MSTDQPDDETANDTDRPTDKHVLREDFTDDQELLRELTSEQRQSYRTKDEKNRNLEDSKDNNNESRVSGDICRICHMGGYPTNDEDRANRVRQARTVRPVDSESSTLSSYSYLGPLISACKCRGTVALVHAECLERWLTESGHTRCELCGYKYATKRVPRYSIFRSIAIWFNTVIVTRQMFLDVLYLIVTTPLALFSCYICALALRMLIRNKLHDVPWMIVAMLPTCSLTLIAYWGWVVTLGRERKQTYDLIEMIKAVRTGSIKKSKKRKPQVGYKEPEEDKESSKELSEKLKQTKNREKYDEKGRQTVRMGNHW